MRKNTFIATVSHEFQTPLASLRASLEILSTELDYLSKRDIREIVDSLDLSVTNLQLLVDNLLNSASIEAERFTVSPQKTEIDKLLRETITLVQPILSRRSQRLSVELPLPLPSAYLDPYLIQQVLINLLINASKYAPEATLIEVITTHTQTALIIAIYDRGIGLSEGDLKSLFVPFERVNTDQHNAKDGLGLGLWVAKTIIEAHGGTISAKAREGGGTIFWIQLPFGAEI